MSYAMIFPILRELFANSSSGGSSFFGFVQSSGNLVGLLAGLVLGRLSDSSGRRPVLRFCQIIAIIGSVFLTVGMRNLAACGWMLRQVCRSSGSTLSKAFVVDSVENQKDRAGEIAQLMAAQALGFTVGTSVGGYLSRSGPSLSLLCSGCVSVCSLALGALLLPADKKSATALKAQNTTKSQPHNVWSVVAVPSVMALLGVRALTTLAFHCFVSTFPMYAKDRFDINTEELGYWMSLIGLMFGLMNAFVVPSLSKMGTSSTQMICSLVTLTISRFCFAFAYNKVMLAGAQLLVAIGAGMLSTLLTSELSVHAKEHVGFLMGVSESIKSGAGILAPFGSALVYQHYGSGVPSIIAGVLTLCSLAMYCGCVNRTTESKGSSVPTNSKKLK